MILKITGENGIEKACATGSSQVSLLYSAAYQPGDRITLKLDAPGSFCWVQLDDAMPPALVYVKDSVSLQVPFGEGKTSYSPKSFAGDKHLLRAWLTEKDELSGPRNLAFNPYDSHENTGFYPHASANVETRGEAVFAARNAIDGVFENSSHGEWPYESWGINRDSNAALTLDFGREVLVNAIALTLRADFPHDSWWTQATVRFSDGSEEIFKLEKSPLPQRFAVAERKVTGLTLEKLIKAVDDSPFPALTQIEIFGKEIE